MLLRTICAVVLVMCICAAPYEVKFIADQRITTKDNITLVADGYVPITTNSSQTFPILIFPNSWALPQFEYILKCLQLAERGYITLEYETRGWYRSGGEIDVAGLLDQADIGSVIDYAFSKAAEWQLDTTKVGMVGISYGAGLSLFGAATDNRVSAVASLSGWANISNALYENDTPNAVWGTLLVASAHLLGHVNASLDIMFQDLINHRNMTVVQSYSESRSPLLYLEHINKRNIPVFLSNNFLDRLFKPQDMLSFYEKLTTPKMILLNQGSHAEAEATGLVDLTNYVWHNTIEWMDYFLMGINNGIVQNPPVQFQELGSETRIFYPTWPDKEKVTPVTFYLNNRGANEYGGLSYNPTSRKRVQDVFDTMTYSSSTGMGDGIPIISDYLDEFIPITANLPTISRTSAIVYLSQPTNESLLLCGTPSFQVSIFPNSPSWQLYAYLYDVDIFGIGTLMTDAFYTNYGTSIPSQEVYVAADMHSLCQRVGSGRRLAIGFDLYNGLYTQSNSNSSLQVTMFYGEDTFLTLPINYL